MNSTEAKTNSIVYPSTRSVLALPEWQAYVLIAIYVIVILVSASGSILVIIAVIRTKTNIFIGIESTYK